MPVDERFVLVEGQIAEVFREIQPYLDLGRFGVGI